MLAKQAKLLFLLLCCIVVSEKVFADSRLGPVFWSGTVTPKFSVLGSGETQYVFGENGAIINGKFVKRRHLSEKDFCIAKMASGYKVPSTWGKTKHWSSDCSIWPSIKSQNIIQTSSGNKANRNGKDKNIADKFYTTSDFTEFRDLVIISDGKTIRTVTAFNQIQETFSSTARGIMFVEDRLCEWQSKFRSKYLPAKFNASCDDGTNVIGQFRLSETGDGASGEGHDEQGKHYKYFLSSSMNTSDVRVKFQNLLKLYDDKNQDKNFSREDKTQYYRMTSFSDEELCGQATYEASRGNIWHSKVNLLYVEEAKRRGLSCGTSQSFDSTNGHRTDLNLVSFGLQLYNEGKYLDAADKWFQAHSHGNSQGSFNLGLMYFNGDGVSQSYEIAHEYFSQAAERKHVSSMVKLGEMHAFGYFVPKDAKKAYEYIKSAYSIEQTAETSNWMGWAHLNGIGVNTNEMLALDYFKQAEDLGSDYASERLEEIRENRPLIHLSDTLICKGVAYEEEKQQQQLYLSEAKKRVLACDLKNQKYDNSEFGYHVLLESDSNTLMYLLEVKGQMSSSIMVNLDNYVWLEKTFNNNDSRFFVTPASETDPENWETYFQARYERDASGIEYERDDADVSLVHISDASITSDVKYIINQNQPVMLSSKNEDYWYSGIFSAIRTSRDLINLSAKNPKTFCWLFSNPIAKRGYNKDFQTSNLETVVRSKFQKICQNGNDYNSETKEAANSVVASADAVSSDELRAAQKEADRLRDELAALKNEQARVQQTVASDNQIPLISASARNDSETNALVVGTVTDNFEVAELTIDGEPVLFNSNGSFEVSFYVPRNGKTIEIVAFDRRGNSSSKTLKLERGAIQQASGPIFTALNPSTKRVVENPNALALIVGIADYERTDARAAYADRDAQTFYDYARMKLGVPARNIKEFVNDGADELEVILAVKDWIARSTKSGQSDVYVFFAGHGLASDDGEQMYLLPYDGSPRLLEESAISRDALFQDIAFANPRSVTVFLDTCYSGTTRGTDMLIASRPIAIRAKQSPIPEGFTVFTAAGGDQTAKPLEEAKHGMFSYFLMKGMEGDADANNDNQITAAELHQYVEQNVVQQSAGSQVPELQGDSERVLVRFQ